MWIKTFCSCWQFVKGSTRYRLINNIPIVLLSLDLYTKTWRKLNWKVSSSPFIDTSGSSDWLITQHGKEANLSAHILLILAWCGAWWKKPLVCACLGFSPKKRLGRDAGKYVWKQQWIEYLKQPCLRQIFLSFIPMWLRWKRQSLKIVVWWLEGNYLSKAKYHTNDSESCPLIVF